MVRSDIRIAMNSRPLLTTQPISAHPVTAAVQISTCRSVPGADPTTCAGISRNVTDAAP